MNQLDLGQEAEVTAVRSTKTASILNPRGFFVVEHWRKGQKIDEYRFPNGITNQGKNSLLDIMFHGATQITTWYLGMIETAGYTALAATDTYQNIGQSGQSVGMSSPVTLTPPTAAVRLPARMDRGCGFRSDHHQCKPRGVRHHRLGNGQGLVPRRRHRSCSYQGRPCGQRRSVGDRFVHRRRRGREQRGSIEGDVQRQRLILPRRRPGRDVSLGPVFFS